MKWYKDVPGVHEIIGDYGSVGIVIPYSLFEENEDINNTVIDLVDEGCLDEDDVCKLEQEILEEDWESFIRKDLIGELDKNNIEHPDGDELFSLFLENANRQDIYPIYESAVSCYIKVKEVVKEWITGKEKWDVFYWDFQGFPQKIYREINNEKLLEVIKELDLMMDSDDLWKLDINEGFYRILRA